MWSIGEFQRRRARANRPLGRRIDFFNRLLGVWAPPTAPDRLGLTEKAAFLSNTRRCVCLSQAIEATFRRSVKDSDRLHFRIWRAQSGDREALDALLRSVQDELLRHLRRTVSDAALADAAREKVFERLEHSESLFKMLCRLVILLEVGLGITLIVLTDFSDELHRLIFVVTCVIYSPLICGLLTLWAHANRNTARMLQALERVADDS